MKTGYPCAPCAATAAVVNAAEESLHIPAKFAARTPEEIRSELCGFPGSCIGAALLFQRTGAPDAIAAMLPGMIEFHQPSGVARPAGGLNDDYRLKEDLGLDSLSLTEMAYRLDELLGVSIEIRDVVGIETVGDLKSFLFERLKRA